MPMYLDRHDLVGITAQQLADAHLQDLAGQDKHSVRYHTYWFDEERGSVFCLAEGPNREALEAVHRDAHGQVASWILELDHTMPLNSYLGGMPSHPPGEAYAEPAMRVIAFTDMCGSVAQTQALGDEGHLALLDVHDDLVRTQLREHNGREVKHTGDGIMAAFNSAVSAVAFATGVQRGVIDCNEDADHELQLRIGMTAGEPVTKGDNDLFGTAVQMAARLCAAADPGDILVSHVLFELCAGKSIVFEDRGEVRLKGIADPMQAFTVQWRSPQDR
jgi:class 3 adenylate cyclase